MAGSRKTLPDFLTFLLVICIKQLKHCIERNIKIHTTVMLCNQRGRTYPGGMREGGRICTVVGYLQYKVN